MKTNLLEKHYQTLVISGSMALMLWVGTGVATSKNQILVLTTTIEHMSTQNNRIIGDIEKIERRMESRTDSRYRAADARRDFSLRDQQIKIISNQIMDLQKRIDKR